MPNYSNIDFKGLRDIVNSTNPDRFKYKIGDDISVIRNPPGVNNPVVTTGMRGVIRDYSPIVETSDGEMRSYHVEFQDGKVFITHEDCIELTKNLDPEHFRIK